MTTAPFLSLHALHSLPAGCLNRDRDGAINTIPMGGTTRIRISSRALRRAMREHMRTRAIDGGAFGIRTTRLPLEVVDRVDPSVGDRDQVIARVAALFTAIGIKTNDKTGGTKVMLFVGPDAADRIATVVSENFEQITAKKVPDHICDAAIAALDVDNVVDVALFGRFLSEISSKTIAGAVNAAHAFSVHPAGIEADFWTAVDDLRSDGDPASSNLGWMDLAAPVVYRYIALDRRTLAHNLRAAPDTVPAAAEHALAEAFIHALPTGRRTSTAATTLPEFVVAVESGRDTSMANAFTRAITDPDALTAATNSLFGTIERSQRWLPDATVRVLPITADPTSLPVPQGWTVVDDIDALVGRR